MRDMNQKVNSVEHIMHIIEGRSSGDVFPWYQDINWDPFVGVLTVGQVQAIADRMHSKYADSTPEGKRAQTYLDKNGDFDSFETGVSNFARGGRVRRPSGIFRR